jgi:hypothetical protein
LLKEGHEFYRCMPKTLAEVLEDQTQALTLKQIGFFVKKLLLCLQFAHSKDIAHLNINP